MAPIPLRQLPDPVPASIEGFSYHSYGSKRLLLANDFIHRQLYPLAYNDDSGDTYRVWFQVSLREALFGNQKYLMFYWTVDTYEFIGWLKDTPHNRATATKTLSRLFPLFIKNSDIENVEDFIVVQVPNIDILEYGEMPLICNIGEQEPIVVSTQTVADAARGFANAVKSVKRVKAKGFASVAISSEA